MATHENRPTNHRRPIGRRAVLAMLGAGGVALAEGVRAEASKNSGVAPTDLKTIGVLGGLGPQATMDFEVRVHRIAQRLIPPHANTGYPPMVIYYHRHPPFLVSDDFSPRVPIEPDPRLLEAAKRIGALADFLVIPSNGPHLVQQQIEQAAGRQVLSMIDATLQAISHRSWQKVGVLGFGYPVIYTDRLAARHIGYETIDDTMRGRLDKEIIRVMEGRDGAESTAVAQEAVDILRARNVDGIILGCTELPLLLRGSAAMSDLVDPAQLLAEAAVRRAMA
jgi:aspartate racemase